MARSLTPVPILLACHRLHLGGSERQLTETARALDRTRFKPHVASFHAEGIRLGELEAAGIPVLALPVRSFQNATAFHGARLFRRYVAEQGIRLVHSFDVPLNIFSTATWAFGKRPVVLTSQRGHRDLTGGFYRRLSRVADRLTDGIVVNCEYMRRHLIEDEKVPGKRIELCYNGIDTGIFAPGPAPRPPDLAAANPLIGIVCALRPEKDIPTLIRAFAELLKHRPVARLLILGSGPEHAALTQLARELAVDQACRFEPATSDVVPWLRMLDIFVLPSREEALSNAIVEAMACGACVVASRVGGNAELTGENERGLLFPSGDHACLGELLLELADNPLRRANLANAARSWVVQALSLSAMAARMGAIYDLHLRSGQTEPPLLSSTGTSQ